jgi:hypothetical protein
VWDYRCAGHTVIFTFRLRQRGGNSIPDGRSTGTNKTHSKRAGTRRSGSGSVRQRCRKSTNAFTLPNGMMTIKNAATAQFDDMTWNPRRTRTRPSRRIRIVRGPCDLPRWMGFVIPAMLARPQQPCKFFHIPCASGSFPTQRDHGVNARGAAGGPPAGG